MAFPVVHDADKTSGSQTSNGTTWAAGAYPTNIQVGDLLLFMAAADGSGLVTPAGFTAVSSGTINGAATISIWARVVDGTEGSTFGITCSANEQGAWLCYRISTWRGGTINLSGVDPASNLNAGGSGAGVSGTPFVSDRNAPPVWGTADILWINVLAVDTSRTVSAYPASFTDGESLPSGGSNGATVAVCRLLSSSSPQPPSQESYTISNSDDYVTHMVLVRPLPPTMLPVGPPLRRMRPLLVR